VGLKRRRIELDRMTRHAEAYLHVGRDSIEFLEVNIGQRQRVPARANSCARARAAVEAAQGSRRPVSICACAHRPRSLSGTIPNRRAIVEDSLL